MTARSHPSRVQHADGHGGDVVVSDPTEPDGHLGVGVRSGVEAPEDLQQPGVVVDHRGVREVASELDGAAHLDRRGDVVRERHSESRVLERRVDGHLGVVGVGRDRRQRVRGEVFGARRVQAQEQLVRRHRSVGRGGLDRAPHQHRERLVEGVDVEHVDGGRGGPTAAVPPLSREPRGQRGVQGGDEGIGIDAPGSSKPCPTRRPPAPLGGRGALLQPRWFLARIRRPGHHFRARFTDRPGPRAA